jgi:hypothetical protein
MAPNDVLAKPRIDRLAPEEVSPFGCSLSPLTRTTPALAV